MAQEFGSRLSAILSPTRGLAPDARARAIAMAVYQCVSPRTPNLSELGRVFERDRTTVRHALDRVDLWRGEAGDFEDRFQAVLKRVNARR